jgi:hypothetical protein
MALSAAVVSANRPRNLDDLATSPTPRRLAEVAQAEDA